MKYNWLSYRFCYANRPHFYLLPAIAQFQTKRGGLRVRVLGDKQQVALIVKKYLTSFAKVSSLVLIGPLFNKISLFKNLRIYKEMYG